MSTAAAAHAAVNIPVRPATVRLYLRHCFQPPTGVADPTRIPTPQTDGRWLTAQGTCYVAEDEPTVWAECCRAFAGEVDLADPTGGVGMTARSFPAYAAQPVGRPLPSRALFSVDLAVDQLADLTSPGAALALRALGLSPSGLVDDDQSACRALAQAGSALGWQALRAPSAALRGGRCVALFSSAVPPAASWQLVRANARPTIAAATVTRYRDGQRPAWLPAV